MATTSFDKDFKVTDDKVINKFKMAAANPRKVAVKKRNYESDKSKGIQLLTRQLSNSGM
ncbi:MULTISPECIES: hypothetical protein [Aliivibrio]|uniref:hypothetical protein n=1 Tax=Aliivibrio TaxID=511678 RepID=UPI0013EE2729|nr:MULTISPECIES: hypothetical protein [Aliivibrio]MDD9177583.1 hypothetical protein [Aliivibrio sp. A6]